MTERSRSRLNAFTALAVNDREQRRDIQKIGARDRSLPDWITPALSSPWVNFGGTEDTVGYWRDSSGIVYLKGVIKSGTIPSAIFFLPDGLKPLAIRRFPVYSNGALGFVTVAADGQVTVISGSNVSVELSSINFRAEQ